MMDTQRLYEIYLQHPEVVTDSRAVREGSLFFALRGGRFDGNQFAAGALEAGAAYAVVDEPTLARPGGRFLLVEDVLTTLQALARHHRRQFDIPVIGITGSNGKTTTKELSAAVLGSHYRLHYTQGNLNNHIGLPLTLLAMPTGIEVAVIEMGANHQGEIDMLCRITEPTHGLITNIGKAHLEGFGGIEGVKKGKSELYRYLAQAGGTVFINRDEPFLEELAAPAEKKVFYRRSETPSPTEPDFEAKLLATQPFVSAAFLGRQGQLVEVRSRLPGAFNFSNIMTAITLGKYFKVPDEKIAAAIEGYTPGNNRSQIRTYNGNTLIMDAYNANPTSMREALLAFRSMDGGPKLAIIGEMLELGAESRAEHEAIALLATSQHFREVAFVGKEFRNAAEIVGCRHFDDVAALKSWFDAQGYRGYHILIKGSRGNQLEKLLD